MSTNITTRKLLDYEGKEIQKHCLWYLGSPYSSDDPQTEKCRLINTAKATRDILLEGYMIYSPIAYCGSINELVGGIEDGSFKMWERFDFEMLDRVDGLIVLMLDGWDDSVGVGKEIDWVDEVENSRKYSGLPYRVCFVDYPLVFE